MAEDTSSATAQGDDESPVEPEDEQEAPADEAEEVPLARKIGLWAICVIVGAYLIAAAGFPKAIGSAMAQNPNWLRFAQGLLEMSGGLLLLIPRTRFYGVGLIWIAMLWEIVNRFKHGPLGIIPFYVMVLTFTGIVAYYHLPDFIRARLPQKEEPPPPIF
jgi:hypothetical protein